MSDDQTSVRDYEEIVIQRFHPKEKKWKDHSWQSRGRTLKECQEVLRYLQGNGKYRIIRRCFHIEEYELEQGF